MTSRKSLDYIKNYGVWSFAAVHGWTKPDEKLVESFEVIKKDLETLAQYKQIEEELGIDLITYFKLKVGVEVHTNLISNISKTICDKLGEEYSTHIDKIFGSGENTMYHIVPQYSVKGVFVGLNEYGKTWALTKEELENGK